MVNAAVLTAVLLTNLVAGAQKSGGPVGAEATPPAQADQDAAPAPRASDSQPSPPAPPAISTLVFSRVGFRLQDPTAPRRLEHLSVDDLSIAPGASGNILDSVGWSFSLFGQGQTQSGAVLPSGGNMTVLDLIAKLDLFDALHVWLGRMIIPADRSGFSGPYFMSAWNYPGLYVAGGIPIFVGPKADYLGRGVGATAWGELGGGVLKYHAGAYQLDRPAGYPLYSARINLALINREPGYYSSSTYYGTKKILAIGVGGQFQRDGSREIIVDPVTGTVTPGASRDFRELNADLLAEFDVGRGTLTGELAVYHFDGHAPAAPVDLGYFGLIKYLVPGDIAGGRLEPLFRYQATRGPDMSMIDAALGYILAGPMLRFHTGFQRTDMGKNTQGARAIGNAIHLGVQLLYL
jgi:hypothetical protein